MEMSIGRFLYNHTKFKKAMINYRNRKIKVDIADTLLKQSIGLMYRETLKRNTGMLFILRHESALGIWMLNMKFSIDIIWLDRDSRVIHIVEYAAPCSSLRQCPIYRPLSPAKYVLEMAGGAAKSLGIGRGSRFHLHAHHISGCKKHCPSNKL